MDSYVVKAKAILDGTGAPPLENGWMQVADGRIQAVGVSPPPAGERVVDFGDCYLLPGFVDSHSHLSIVPSQGNQLAQMALPPGRNVLRSLPNIRTQLESGVTTIRVMGEEYGIDLDIRQAIEEGLLQGPRLVVSGTPIVASNGHGVAVTTSDTPGEVRKNIRRNFRRGADFVKLFITGGMSSARPPVDFCSYSREEVAAAVDEAARMKSYVAAHAHGGPGVDLCIAEGVRTIEHGALLTPEQIRRMRDSDMWVVITSSILFHKDGIEKTDFSNPQIREKVLRNREIAAATFGRVFEEGLPYGVGTDSMHGLIAYEAECLTRFGASNMDAVRALTAAGARICQLEDQIGTLEPGKQADFVAISQNPLADITALRDVRAVFIGGEKLVDKRGGKPND